MKEETKIWLALIAFAATVVIAISLYNIKEINAIASMVESGSSPIEASCAIFDSMGNNPTCVALVVTK